MCGIFGFLINNQNHNINNLINKMSNSILHRGPDSQGSYIGNKFVLGINRLQIIDLITGDQPIESFNKKNIIVFNGEIYNYLELREELISKGYFFKTKTDTEVVVNIFQEYGIDGFAKLNGMFSFAILNKDEESIIIVRDRFGIKPLYYYYDNNSFVFGSEIKSILKYPNINKKINLDSIDFYMTMENIPAPFTIYENIKKLEAGCFIQFKKNNLECKRWYNYQINPKIKNYNENEVLEKTKYLIQQAVNRASVSDVPIGTFLSGGIDSSLITYYLSKISNSQINTFSMGFNEKSFDESNNARQISKHLDTNHFELILDPKTIIDSLDKIYSNIDEPFADPSLIPTYYLSKFTSQHIKVAISGDGGDEIFGGYPTYLARNIASFVPKNFSNFINFFINKIPSNFNYLSFDYKLKKFFNNIDIDPDIRHLYWLGSFNHRQKKELYKDELLKLKLSKNIFEKYIIEYMNKSNLVQNWERSLYLDSRFYLSDNNLAKTDMASMLNSLEVRVPFLDNDLTEYISKLPISLKYKGLKSKYLLRKINKEFLPKHIANLPKKGFGVPIAKWINKDLKTIICDTLLSDDLIKLNYFNNDYIKKIIDNHWNKKNNNRKEIWTIYCFAVWNSKNN